MEKIVYKVVSFMVIFALALALLDDCVGCVKSATDSFLNSLFNPLKSCSNEDNVTGKDLYDADPIEFKYYVTAQIVKHENVIKNISVSNTNIKQEISPVNVLVNKYNQTVTNQNKYIKQTYINQTTLLEWVEENNTNIDYLKTKSKNLATQLDNIQSEIDGLKKQVKSLENAIRNKHFDKDHSKILGREDFNEMKIGLENDIKELSNKISALTKELNSNKSLIKDLNQSIEDCVHNIEEINKKLDKLIIKGGQDTTQSPAPTEEKTYYYIIDTEDELKTMGIVSKDGILGGIFGGLKVTPDPNKDLFALLTKSDRSILLGSEDYKFEVLSDMPDDSYQYRTINKITVLIITDVEKFWSQTEFLVIKQSE